MEAFFVNIFEDITQTKDGGVGLVVGGGDALPYRNRLEMGKYIVVVQVSEAISRQVTRILRKFEPENIQGYADTSST